jgi:hypothetical protein
MGSEAPFATELHVASPPAQRNSTTLQGVRLLLPIGYDKYYLWMMHRLFFLNILPQCGAVQANSSFSALRG